MDNNDWNLLQQYARENAEGAFHALVRRYAGLVHASAFRQTGDAQLAQDVAQAVFTLLARKAGSLRPGTVLSGWLFQTTRFVAARAVRADQRRRRREQEAFDMQQLLSGEEAWRRMAPVIDDAVSRLGANDREAILLRHLRGEACERWVWLSAFRRREQRSAWRGPWRSCAVFSVAAACRFRQR